MNNYLENMKMAQMMIMMMMTMMMMTRTRISLHSPRWQYLVTD